MTMMKKVSPLACGCDSLAARGGLVSVSEALDVIGREVHPLQRTEAVPLTLARGRVLADAVHARAAMPRFDNSAMDGYALRRSDLAGEGPWELPIADTVFAGDGRSLAQPPGAAIRIFTGARLPGGADAVVMQEEVEQAENGIRILRRPESGQNVRRAGEDQAQGALVLRTGARLGPREIAAAAGAGAGSLVVRARPRVALVTTGDEVVPAGAPLEGGAIWDINTPMMAAAIEAAGGEVASLHGAPDRLETTVELLAYLSDTADLVITTGGVSVGAADFILPALKRLGGATCFSGVAIKPGKPVTLGRAGSAMVLALPGNPLSALVVWQVFGLPLMARMSGDDRMPRVLRVTCDRPLRHRPGRMEFRPARLNEDGRTVVADAPVHSGRITDLATADGLVCIPAEAETVSAGTTLDFLPFPF